MAVVVKQHAAFFLHIKNAAVIKPRLLLSSAPVSHPEHPEKPLNIGMLFFSRR